MGGKERECNVMWRSVWVMSVSGQCLGQTGQLRNPEAAILPIRRFKIMLKSLINQ